MLRNVEYPGYRPKFDDLAMLQDCDVVAQGADHGQIMADEYHGETKPRAQFLEQQQDMGLGRHVETGHDLVGDE